MERDTVLYFMHGSGGNGRDIQTFLQTVPLEDFGFKTFVQVLGERGVDLVTPTAPLRPYMPCCNEEMRVWFNRSPTVFKNGTLDTYEDVAGTDASINQILGHIAETSGRYKNVIVGGLSMGGCLALYLLGRSELDDRIKGVFSMGSFMVDATSLFQQPRPGGFLNNRIPVLMMHGKTR
jgi:predicted esterase